MDAVDIILLKINSINAQNCGQMDIQTLNAGSVTDLPSILTDEFISTSANRTDLLHARNTAVQNALFFSYILQLFDDYDEFYLTHIYSLISSNLVSSQINASFIVFDNDSYYAHWYRGSFNTTVHRFGPVAWRQDDFYEPFNLKGIWTNDTISGIVDTAIFGNKMSQYQWYNQWLPDFSEEEVKNVYKIIDANKSRQRQFHGMPLPRENKNGETPAEWTLPYFDCGISNKWVVSVSSPIVDLVPRHVEYRHMQKFR
ncbi:hypothetical protein ACOME3_004289 [Neoechinorhynchus agilis]